jgi:hypothetical protein
MTAPAALAEALAAHYRLDRQLGEGGIATAYLARDLKHGRDVAIKVLRPDFAESLGRERCLREIQLAARRHRRAPGGAGHRLRHGGAAAQTFGRRSVRERRARGRRVARAANADLGGGIPGAGPHSSRSVGVAVFDRALTAREMARKDNRIPA